MSQENSLTYLLMARGSSHIRYFTAFAKAKLLNVSVVNVNRHLPRPGDLRFLGDVAESDLESLLIPHFAKKERKYPKISKTPLWWLYKQFAKRVVKYDVARFQAIIKQKNADVIGVWNGQKLPSSAIALAARIQGKEVVYFENGLLPDTTTCDWSGVNCLNSLPDDPAFYKQFDSDRPLPKHLIPRAPARAKAKGIDVDTLPSRFVFVPFQVETDSQIITNSPWIKSMGQLYQHLRRAMDSISDDELYLVIKEHPSELKRHDELHQLHPRILFANQCDTKALIDKAEAVLTVNSTVGLESLLLDKPVMVMGKACYALQGVCEKISDENALVEGLRDPKSCYGDVAVRRGFLNFLHEHYVIPTTWKDAQEQHFTALTQRLLKTDNFSDYVAAYNASKSRTLQ
ncbi:hypothetical protein [Alteromonas sp. H39]|uniref:capsular polysaccharide export protein, LipB/KpsS family n=1 Tax=Alteromonas sp. H39 TaxID=3389876 RepID=UPI0039DF765B